MNAVTGAGIVGRKRKKNGFTQISNFMLEDSSLSWRAKGLLAYLLSRPNNWKVNKTDLINRAKEGREAVQNALNELKQAKYLHIYRTQDELGKFGTWVWEYDDIPYELEEESTRTTENPQENTRTTGNQQKTGENVLVYRNTGFPNDGKTERRETRIYNNKDFNNKDFNNTKDKNTKNTCADKPARISSPELENEFEKLWQLYPKKIGKKKAFDHFKRARKVKKTPYEHIENGLYLYIKHIRDKEIEDQFIKHGSTWFNQEGWKDEYLTLSPKSKPKNALEFFNQEYGGDTFEHAGNGEIIDDYSEVLSEPFQGFRP